MGMTALLVPMIPKLLKTSALIVLLIVLAPVSMVLAPLVLLCAFARFLHPIWHEEPGRRSISEQAKEIAPAAD